MEIFLVRHCQALGQEANAPLTEAGRQQAYFLAEFLQKKEIGSIISSPFLRARQSVQPLAEQLGLSIAEDERLGERILCARNHPDWLTMLEKTFDDLDLCYPGGESSREAMHRALLVIQEVITSRTANTVVATHGNLLSLLLKHYDDSMGFAQWQGLTNPDVYQLSIDANRTKLQRIWMG